MESIKPIETVGGAIPLYVRYKEGCKIFGMSQRQFKILADRSGSVHKVGRMSLVNTVAFNEYLQPYRIPSGARF